jgi:hypothetical protein
VPCLLPFCARYAPADAIYIPGEEPPKTLDPTRLSELKEPALFFYRQGFGESVRHGVMGLLNRNEATVLPHEETLPERVAGCAQSIAEGMTDPGSLWLWCHDEAGEIARLLQPANDCIGAECCYGAERCFGAEHSFGAEHRVWPISDPATIGRIQTALQGKPFFLADGHHRFAAGWDVATIQVRNETLRSLPAHRLISDPRALRLPPLRPVADLDAFRRQTPPGAARFGVFAQGQPLQGFEIACRPGESKLAALRRQVIGETPVQAVRDTRGAAEGQAVLLVEAVEIDTLEDDARRGILLPPKSTDFYPKLAAGLVIKG